MREISPFIARLEELRVVFASPCRLSMRAHWVIVIQSGSMALPILFSVRYYSNFRKSRRMDLEYVSELETLPISNVESARTLIINDVIKRREKIEEFEKNYGVKIRPINTFEEIRRRLGIRTEH